MKYETQLIELLKQTDLRKIFGTDNAKRSDCPVCHHSGGLEFYQKDGRYKAKCFHCDAQFSDLLSAVSTIHKLDYKEDFLQIVEIASKMAGVNADNYLVSEEPSQEREPFYLQQLKASGLTLKDVMVKARDSKTDEITEVPAFCKGSIDRMGNINNDDDEMLINYYDLNGKHRTYYRPGTKTAKPYVRVRWSNPEIHTSSDGKPIKYQTPRGAVCQFYIPQKIRELYLSSQKIETLFIQEGEKKAEKACKHGIHSIGIQGIYNIGNSESGLIQDLQYLAQTCSIRNIVLLMDSDWNDLSRHLQKDDAADLRPSSFAKAVIKFRDYVNTLHNCGIDVNIYFAHINENEHHDKGIDDLLVNTLRYKEHLLLEDIDRTLHSHNGKGQHLDIHNISTMTEYKIKDFWHLNSIEDFFEAHKEKLSEIEAFKFDRKHYIVNDGKVSKYIRYKHEEMFWDVKISDKGSDYIDVDQVKMIKFIEGNGYNRIKTIDCDVDRYKYMHMDGNIIKIVGASDIRSFVYSYVSQATKDPSVQSFFAKFMGKVLSPDRLERLQLLEDKFENFEMGKQMFYFQDICLEVTSSGIKESVDHPQVWVDKIIDKPFTRVPIIKNINKTDDGNFTIEYSEDAKKCDFLQFLLRTSDFWNTPTSKSDEFDEDSYNRHIVNKVTTIGYMLTDYKYLSEQKAVIAMDGMIGEIAESNGRTGKSLVGVAVSKMLNQIMIDGRNCRNDDEFLYSLVTPRTRNIFIDDVKKTFDFERFFLAITGDLIVNPKMAQRFVLHYEESPKFYITTNHAINADSRSATERIIFMVFSNWYNEDHRPLDDFERAFFSSWDNEQWNLFYNFMVECCYYYLYSMDARWYRLGQGAVPPPMDNIKKRQQKQIMGDSFLQWAELFFDSSQNNLNVKLNRKDVVKSFTTEYPTQSASISPALFKRKLLKFCEYSGFHFNPHKPNAQGDKFSQFIRNNPKEVFVGISDKTNGNEYILIANDSWVNN